MMGIDDNNDTHEYNDILTEEEGHHLGTPTNKNCALHLFTLWQRYVRILPYSRNWWMRSSRDRVETPNAY